MSLHSTFILDFLCSNSFLRKRKDKQAQILSEKDYQNAADIAIENEKI